MLCEQYPAQCLYGSAVQRVLAAVGEFYQADRAYLFEPHPAEADSWSNTYEWCRNNVASQRGKLQRVSLEPLERWLRMFRQGHSVIIFNLDALQHSSRAEWEMLVEQNISGRWGLPARLQASRMLGISICSSVR